MVRNYVPESAVVILESFHGGGDYKSAHNDVDITPVCLLLWIISWVRNRRM